MSSVTIKRTGFKNLLEKAKSVDKFGLSVCAVYVWIVRHSVCDIEVYHGMFNIEMKCVALTVHLQE